MPTSDWAVGCSSVLRRDKGGIALRELAAKKAHVCIDNNALYENMNLNVGGCLPTNITANTSGDAVNERSHKDVTELM
jgi:hypothetical protein